MVILNIDLYIRVFIAIFIIADPLGNLIPFLHLTKNISKNKRNQIAIKAVTYASLILIVFALIGKFIFKYLNISVESLQIVGGILLFIIALNMMFKGKCGTFEKTKNIAMTPLAIPFLAGPGTIAIAMVFMNEAMGVEKIGVIISILLSMLLVLTIFLSLNFILKLLKKDGIITVGKVLTIFLGALAVEMIISGIKVAFSLP
jgi:multiple antibiotic resistance protein